MSILFSIDPWKELARLRREFENPLLRNTYYPAETSFPLINVHDTSEEVVVVAELPGIQKEDVSVTMENNVLTIAGKRKGREDTREVTVLRKERAEGEFEKTVRLATKVKDGAVTATFKEGILTIKLPKAEEVKPKQISITT